MSAHRRASLRAQRVRGVSLLELMVVLAITGVLLVLATPSMAEWIRNQRIRGSAENLLNGLQKAREEAIRRNRPVSFWLVSDLGSGCTLSSNSGIWVISLNSPVSACNAAPSSTADPLLVATSAPHEGPVVQASDVDGAASTQARFDGYGRAMAVAQPLAQISVVDRVDADKPDPATHAYRSLRIVVQGTGAIRMCDPRVTAAGDTRAC